MRDLFMENKKETVNAKLRPFDNKRMKTLSCLLYTSPSPRDRTRSRMPSSAWKKKNTQNIRKITSKSMTTQLSIISYLAVTIQ